MLTKKKYLLCLFLCVEVLFLFAVFFYKVGEISPDFKVFYLQSERLVNGGNVFEFNDYVAYNSTFLYLLISPLTLFDLNVASSIFLFINAALVPIISTQLTLLLEKKFSLETFIVIFAILEVSFFVRSILNNGQVGLIMLLLVLFAIQKLVMENQNSWSVAITLWFSFELKPYLIVIFLIWLYLIKRNNRLVLKFLSVGIGMELLYFIINPSANVANYVSLILDRVNEVSSELDQSSIAAILFGVAGAPKLLAYFVHVLVALIVFLRIRPYINKFNLISIALIFNFTSLINVYLHRQDPIITILIFSLLWQQVRTFMRNKENRSNNENRLSFVIFSIALALLANWGNPSVLMAMAMNVLLIIILILTEFNFKSILIILIATLVMQSTQIYVLKNYGWIASYELWRVLILAYTLLCSSIILQSKLDVDSKKSS
jgi:hypothetical protein